VCGCSVLDLDAFERCNKAEGLGVSDGTTQAKNLQDTDNTCKLFRFLQLLCEGHNLGMEFSASLLLAIYKLNRCYVDITKWRELFNINNTETVMVVCHQ